MPDYTCVQTVDRRYFERQHPEYPLVSCDQLRSLDSSAWVPEATDRLRLDIKVSQGMEIGSWKGSQFTESNIFKMTGGGPYGTGMLGPLIADIFMNGGATYTYMGDDAYGYQVPLASSHYRVNARSGWATAAFSGVFWLDSKSLDLKRLLLEAHDLPAETSACSVDTSVEYQQMQVGTGQFLLPRQSSMHLVMRDENVADTTAVYSNCRVFLGESTIRFDDVPAGNPGKAPVVATAPLPAGLHLSLALTEPIDTDTAAAGDMVRAKLRAPLREPKSKTILARAGAGVQGRIVEQKHWLEQPRYFKISIMLEKLEVDGGWRPLFAEIDRVRGPAVVLPPVGWSPLVAAFRFTTEKQRYLLPAGYQINWVTVEPLPKEKK